MAQVCGDTTFDFVARRKHDTALGVLSHAADIWAARGRDALSVDAVVAILLRIFLAHWPWMEYGGLGLEARPLESWLSRVGTGKHEAESLIPAEKQPCIPEVLSLLHAELSAAVDGWLLGHPEQPPTIHAINAVEHILFTHRLIHRPASAKLPTSFRTVEGDKPIT